MAASINRRRWVGTAVALLALVLGFGTVAVAPAPAHAADYLVYCFPAYDEDGNYLGQECVTFHLPVERETCDFCPDLAVGFDYLVNPPDDLWWFKGVVVGLGLLDQAATNPRQADQLLAEAQEAFLVSAERLGETRIGLGEVGILDPEGGAIEPVPEPWLVAGGTDLVDGVGFMQQALAGPDPVPWLEAGMDQFQEAYQELALHEVIGR